MCPPFPWGTNYLRLPSTGLRLHDSVIVDESEEMVRGNCLYTTRLQIHDERGHV